MTGVWLLALLLTKHFIADFPLQFPVHYLNKGVFWHKGGWDHAAIHAVMTLAIVAYFAPLYIAGIIAVLEMIAHHQIDWAKMRINAELGLKPDNSEYFWWLLGFDQWLHHATYVVIAWFVITRGV